MSERATSVLTEVLGWSADERGELAARLLDSLDPAPDDGAEAAWAAEVRARLADLRAGRVTPVPWAEARQQILADDDGEAG